MPDITAARPVSGAPIESAWGGQVHDQLEGVQGGQMTAASGATSITSWTGTVTFPRPYTAPPVVVATVGAWGTTFYMCIIQSITATNFVLLFVRRDGAAVSNITAVANWLAMGTPA